LGESEITFSMQNVRGTNCGGFNNPALDLWNHRINIALGKSSKYPQMIIWSNGKDNISGTDDDLIVPYGQKVPK